jgi:diguanylate cyclase (GGDEF)-like protein
VQDQTIPVIDHHGKLIRIDGIVSNITDQKEKEYKIKQLAYHDDISELPNRRMFDKKVKSLIESSNNNKQIFTFLKLNIDRFKNINTSLGHRIANNLLKQFGERIKNLLPESSLLARISGDYFGILLWDYHQSDAPEALAKSVIESMKQPFFVGDYELFVTTSIGISTFPSNGENIVELEKCAELALSHAKEIGINNYQLYSPSLAIKSNKLYSLEKDLRKAIENEELILHFQPRVEPNTEKIVGAEALIRWEHPVMGLVSPNEFIPLAEEIGFIDTIGDWVIKQVCQSINKWKKKGVKIVPISINISAQRFLKSDWKKFIHIILEETNMNPSMLELEITETTLIRHEEAVYSAIQFLKELGIKIALDDFGTGYSSLTHLRQYPIDTIKIDKSFIDNITKEESEAVIAKSILYLSKGLNINVVAEGVETIEQLTFLKEHECKEIQGYIFSKPVSEKEFLRLLNIIQLKPTYQETY